MSGGSVRISRGSRVPLRRQIAVQLAGAIGSDRMAPGRRLPSTRALAKRIGVHRGTVRAAYMELADQGLVRLRQGSGTYVGGDAGLVNGTGASDASGSGGRSDDLLAGSFASFFAAERAAGRSAMALARDLGRWRSQHAAGRLLVVTREPALRAIVVAELAPALPHLRVEGVTWSRVCSGTGRNADPELPPGLLAVPAGLAPGVRRRLPRWREVIPVRLGDDGTARRLLAEARSGSLVAVVSASAWFRRRLLALGAGLRGDEIGVAVSPPDDRRRVERITRVARLVIADRIAAPRMVAPAARRRGALHRIPVLAEHSLCSLVQYLCEDADRACPGRGGGP